MWIKNKIIIRARTYIYKEKFFLKNSEKSLWIKKKFVYLQCNQKTKNKMKTTVLSLLLIAFVFNVNAQKQKSSVKDTVFVGDSVAYPKLQEGKKFFAIYKGKKVRAAKKDSGKKVFLIYNTNAAGERRISKIYYAN